MSDLWKQLFFKGKDIATKVNKPVILNNVPEQQLLQVDDVSRQLDLNLDGDMVQPRTAENILDYTEPFERDIMGEVPIISKDIPSEKISLDQATNKADSTILYNRIKPLDANRQVTPSQYAKEEIIPTERGFTVDKDTYTVSREKGMVPVKSVEAEVLPPVSERGLVNIEQPSSKTVRDVLENGTPEQKNTLLQWIKNNPGKSTTIASLPLAGYGLYKLSNDGSNNGESAQGPKTTPTPGSEKNITTKTEETTPEAKVATKAVAKEIAKSSTPISDKQTVEDKLAEVKEDDSKVLEFGDGSVASLDNLKKVQEQANALKMFANVGPAFENLGANVSGLISGGTFIPKTTDGAFYKGIAAQGDQLLADYKNQIEMEKQDPNSSYTQGLKDFIKKTYGYEIKGDVSAKDLQDSVMKPLENQYNQKLLDDRQRDLRELQLSQQAQIAKMNAMDRADRRQEARDMRTRALDDRQLRHYENRLDKFKKNLQGAGGPTGTQVRNRIVSADAIFNTAGVPASITEEEVKKLPAKDLDKLSRMMVTELAIETNRMLTASGVPAQGTLAKLVPSNVIMDVTRLQDYVTNKMNPAEQSMFVREILKMAARVRNTAKERNLEFVKKYIAGSDDLYNVDPVEFEAVVREYGLDQEDLRKLKVIRDSENTTEKPKARVTNTSNIEAKPITQKTVVKKGYNSKTKQTQLIYSDGTKEIVEGRK